MSIEADIEEMGLKELLKGIGSISNAYLAMRIKQVEAESAEREKKMRESIDNLVSRLNVASQKFREMERLVVKLEQRVMELGESDLC